MKKSNAEITKQLFDFDRTFGAGFVCGADEAGRGPLAGPVVTAAVIMPANCFIAGVNDSKKISELRRERLFDEIIKTAIAYQIKTVDNRVIDEINILQATKRGMEQAILSLHICPDIILVDAVTGLKLNRNYAAVTQGDAKSYAIAAASVLAKVSRDRMMKDYAKQYPAYGFEKHKGYGTAAHYEALCRYGKTPIHRNSFLKKFLPEAEYDGE